MGDTTAVIKSTYAVLIVFIVMTAPLADAVFHDQRSHFGFGKTFSPDPICEPLLKQIRKHRCLDKAAVVSDNEIKCKDFSNLWKLCTVTQVEELKILIRMFPTWATGICQEVNYVCRARRSHGQNHWLFHRTSHFSIDIRHHQRHILGPVYDMILEPFAREFTSKERGFSDLQRMGIGPFISILSMAAATLVEIKPLQLSKELGLVDKDVTVPLNIFWQIPQYFLVGAAEVFTFFGQLEFFYD
ncbi:hypothetical protein Nepgr_028758 [Nepenthes gracilis]|uniref:Uncharacterized protein n=1 Tax=Nepenthes gracilis TaxID=150966 RepID=A0AAD3TAZ4_NEPGR|nr:hypothetical protein Nepgr_028758 [Nepenthes gracilis]